MRKFTRFGSAGFALRHLLLLLLSTSRRTSRAGARQQLLDDRG